MTAPATAEAYAPAPGAASLPRMVLAQGAMEARLLVRNGEQLLLALVVPLLVLVGGQQASELFDIGAGRRIDVLAPGVLALAVLSTAFTSLAIATGFERRSGVLKRLGVSPLPREGLLLGKVAAVLLVELGQLAVLVPVALALGWEPRGGASAAAGAAVLVLLGTAAFGALALLLAGTLRAESTLAAANLIHLLLLAGGGVVLPLDQYPDAVSAHLGLLPSGALGEGLREVLAGGGLEPGRVLVLLAWAGVASVLVARSFRWE